MAGDRRGRYANGDKYAILIGNKGASCYEARQAHMNWATEISRRRPIEKTRK